MPPPDDLPPDDAPRLARPARRRRDPEYDDAPEFEPEDDRPSSNDKTMGMLAHLLGLFTWVIGPAILLFTHGDKSPFVQRHARESLNCQVSQVFVYMVGVLVCALIGGAVYFMGGRGVTGFLAGYALFILFALGYVVFELVCIIKASIAASAGNEYRYPLTIRLF